LENEVEDGASAATALPDAPPPPSPENAVRLTTHARRKRALARTMREE
jgi:hypothetical protein